MGATTTVKVCKLCGRDVSQLKRVKDPKGNYYCEECYATAASRQGQPVVMNAAPAPKAMPHVTPQMISIPKTPVPAPAPQEAKPITQPMHLSPTNEQVEITAELASALAEVEDLSSDLLPIETVDQDLPPAEDIAPVPEADMAQNTPRKTATPTHCPACGTPVISGRRLCIKCNRDVTIPLAPSLQKQDKPEASEKAAAVFGSVLKLAGKLAVVGLILLVVYIAYYLLFSNAESYQPYPKTRAAAVHQFVGAIAAGTDKSYDKAFEMISYRARASDDPQQRGHYKRLFARINEDLTKKYGKDWLATVELDPKSHQDITTSDDCEIHTLRIGKDKDEYTISTQVQISMEEVIGNIPSRQKVEYPENDKNRFGVLGFAEYPVDWK